MIICHDDIEKASSLMAEYWMMKGTRAYVQVEIERLNDFLTELNKRMDDYQKQIDELMKSGEENED